MDSRRNIEGMSRVTPDPFKHFFGGAALYSNMKICASFAVAEFAFKPSQERCTELIAYGEASLLRYFEYSSIKKGDVPFTDADSLGNAAAASCLKECLAYAPSNEK